MILTIIVITIGVSGFASGGTLVWWLTSHRSSMALYNPEMAGATKPAARPEPANSVVTSPAPTTASSRSVIINARKLSDQQLQTLEQGSPNQIPDGNYWYDRVSGAWGRQGGPCGGFTMAGLNLGPLREDASNGNTGVYVNGRELHYLDVAMLQTFVPVQRGRYWVTAQGTFGYEGGPAVGNLVQLAQAAQRAGRGGRDNFWSSRFAAGNHDDASGSGYVSVPGYGPVGYGPIH